MAGDHLQARPVDLLTEDHQLPEFIFAEPREMVEGLDLKRTSGLWRAIPGVPANEWEFLCVHEDCLDGRPRARIEGVGRMAVNEAMRAMLRELGLAGIAFVRPGNRLLNQDLKRWWEEKQREQEGR